jgi:transposase-like protein
MSEDTNLEELEKNFSEYRKKNGTGIGKKYPEEFKELVRKAYNNGASLRKISLICQIHTECLKRWVVRNKEGQFLFKELSVVPENSYSIKQRKKKSPIIRVDLPNGIKIKIPLESFSTELVHILGTTALRLS